LFTLTALVLFGGVTIRQFVLTLLIGILSGTYSSIFNASPILVVWDNGEIPRFFNRLFNRQRPATA
jgi:preprotein translocase subunit SecF